MHLTTVYKVICELMYASVEGQSTITGLDWWTLKMIFLLSSETHSSVELCANSAALSCIVVAQSSAGWRLSDQYVVNKTTTTTFGDTVLTNPTLHVSLVPIEKLVY